MWILGLAVAQASGFDSQSWCFGSGLRVIFEQDHLRPEVRISTLVEGGSAGEPADQAGLAHLVEHLWFRANGPGGEEVQAYQIARGVRANAYTSEDVTGYTTTGPRAAVRDLLLLEGQRIVDPLAGADSAFDVERGIVESELRERYTDSLGGAMHDVRAEVYPENHPYHRLPIGTQYSLGKLSMKAARAYTDKWYRPEHTSIYLAGDLDPDDVPGLLGRSLPSELLLHPTTGEVMGSCSDRAQPPAPQPKRHNPDEPIPVDANTSRRTGLMVWHIKKEHEVLADFSLWLMDRVLADHGGCHMQARRRGTLGLCSISLDDDADVVKALRKAHRATTELWDPSNRHLLALKFAGYKQSFAVDVYQSLDRRGGEDVVEHFHLTGRPDWLRARLQSRDIADFSKVAQLGTAVLSWKRATTFDIEPASELASSAGQIHATRSARVTNTLDPGKVDVAFLKSLLAEPDWSTIRTYPLENGMKALMMPFGSFETAHVLMSFPSPMAEPVPGANTVAWRSLPWPENRLYYNARTALGRLSVFEGNDASWRYQVSGVRLETQLDVLTETHAGQRVSGATGVRRALAQADADSAQGRAADARWGALLPGIAMPYDALQASVANMANKDVRNWANAKLSPRNGHVVLVGRVDPPKAIGRVRRTLGSIKAFKVKGGQERPAIEVDPPDPILFAAESKRPRSQATVTLSCRIDAADYVGGRILAEVIESRAAELREKQGLTYGVHASARRDVAGRVLTVRTEVDKAGVKQALSKLRGTIAVLGIAGPTPDELARARVVVAGELAEGFQRGAQLANLLASYSSAGVAPEDMGGFAERLMAVDTAHVQGALKSCANHEVLTVVTNDVEATLKAAEAAYTFLPERSQ